MFLTLDVKNFQNLETLLTWKVLSSQLVNGKFIANCIGQFADGGH